MFQLLRRYPLLPLLVPHRRQYGWGILALLLVDLINVILPVVVGIAIDALAPKNFRSIVWASAVYFVLMAVQSIGRYLWRWFLIGSSHRIASRLRLDLFEHLQKLPVSEYQKNRTGDLMSRATNDIESVRMAVGPGVLVSLDAAFLFLMILPTMIWLSPRLSLYTLAFFPLVPFLSTWLGNRIDKTFGRMQGHLSEISNFAQEAFGGIRWVKSLVLENILQKKFEERSELFRLEGMRLSRYESAFSPSLALVTNLGTFFILWFGARDVLAGAITVGTFVAFQRFVVQLSWPMEAIGWTVTMTREGVAAYRRIQEVLHLRPVQSTRVAVTETRELGALRATSVLEIRNLVQPKPGQSEPFLHLDHLHIGHGKKIGLVGAVGSGKSLLLNTLLRLYEPAPERIFFKGRDVASIPLQELRTQVASVEQQVFMFRESVLDNVRLGGVTLTDAEVDKVLRVAAIYDEVYRLPQGRATVLGERGVTLSGGQRQRLALARALARAPGLLLLDDALSAVDVEVEERILDAFFANYPDLSVLFASHRLSVMPRLDEIWVLENGTVVDVGTHSQLMGRSKKYQEMWEKGADAGRTGKTR